MSLVGYRPALESEFSEYSFHHRARMFGLEQMQLFLRELLLQKAVLLGQVLC